MAYKYGVPAFMAGQRHELQGDGVRLESPAFTFMAREAPRADELHRGEFLRPVYRLLWTVKGTVVLYSFYFFGLVA